MKAGIRRAAPAAAALALLALASCPNPLLSDVAAKEAADTGKTISVFSLPAAANAKLPLDVVGVVDEASHSITLSVPKWVPLSNLVAAFSFLGAGVSVNGIAQESGVTANDFTVPVKYTVTPASGSPVVYTVTASTGLQGLMGGVIQGTPLTLTGAVTSMAGQASPFGNPMGMVRVGTTVYVADAQFSVIWAVDAGSGAVSLFAGILGEPGLNDATGTAAQFDIPEGLATDGTYLYVADQGNNRIREIDLGTGAVTTLAGSTVGKLDGKGSAAMFNGPTGLFWDGATTLYETDKFTKLVRTIDVSGTASRGTVTTIIPVPISGASPFASPAGLVVYNSNLYVVDQGANDVLEYGPVGALLPIGGFVSSGYASPTDIISYNSKLYVADSGNQSIDEVNPSTGAATVYAGPGVSTGFDHVDGLDAAAMRFDTPNMLLVSTGSTDTMYVGEAGNVDIRALTINKTQKSQDRSSTLAGAWPGSANGTGSAARFYSPRQMTTNGATVWIGDQLNQLIRGLDIGSGAVDLVAGQRGNPSESEGTGSGAAFNYPAGMTNDGKFIYACDQFGVTVRRIEIATGIVKTIAGGLAGYADGIGTAARFGRPSGITTDGTSLWVTDQSNNSIRRIDLATLQVTTVAGSPPSGGGAAGDTDATGTLALFNNPTGITTDGTSLFVADNLNRAVRKIALQDYAVTTLAGPTGSPSTGGAQGYVTGAGSSSLFRNPIGITTDGTYVYVADQGNADVRKIEIATGITSTLAGHGEPTVAPAEIDATGTAARFNTPIGLTTDGVSLFVTDRTSNVIRRIR